MTLIAILIALIWLGGTCVRVYRQARFYQIEEYMGRRYLRWYFSDRLRWLPSRPLIASALGLMVGFFMAEAPGSILPGVIVAIAALIAVWPPDEGEIKRAFRPTPRAKRILGAAFGLAVFDLLLYLFILTQLPLPAVDNFDLVIVSAAGLLIFLTAPFILVGGNLLMTPIENILRRRFITAARKVIVDLQPVVIGITGSYGKTTTKNYITDILGGRYKVYPTPKSYNTLMGICLAINTQLKNDFSIEYFVVEMGAYIPGEIARICDLTPPNIAVVVEVGPQHLERFGSLENIASAKYEIIKALPPDGVGVFNWDNPHVREMYERGYPATRLAVSKTLAPDAVPPGGPRFIASEIAESLDGLQFTVTDVQTGDSARLITHVIGEHNITNILLATAIAVYEGLSLKDVAFQARKLQPAESRLVRQQTAEGIMVINDAYSANPAGIVSALRVLGMHTSGKRLLITPGMVELGELHEPENYKLGQLAAQYATDIILVGEKQTRPIKEGIEASGFNVEHLQVVAALSDAVNWYKANLRSGDTVMFLNDLPDIY